MQPAPACEMMRSALCMSGASEGLNSYVSTSMPAVEARVNQCHLELRGVRLQFATSRILTAAFGGIDIASSTLYDKFGESPLR